uniref:UAS domain-containing protein n=1 Tax=Angiostrongylus cantonensis TaxID=6313 RepID=A0A0K0D9B8_ANGCA
MSNGDVFLKERPEDNVFAVEPVSERKIYNRWVEEEPIVDVNAGCERIGAGKADRTTHLDSMDGQPAISDISAHSKPNITNLKASMSGAKNTRMTSDSTQNDTMSSKSPDLPPQEVDLTNATPIQSNRVPTEFSTKTSQKNKKKSCVNSNRLRRTAKNPSRSDTLQQKKEEPGGANDDRKTTKSNAEVIKVCRSTKKGTSRPKLGTISGSATDGSRSPLQNAEATEKTTVSSQLKQDDLSLSSKFPALFDGAPSELSTNATGSTESQRRRRPRISISAPLEIPEFPKKAKNPRADIKRFCSDYANKFAIGSRHTVEFFNGSFDDAQKESRNAIRLMLVFFHDPTSEDSKRFIHESMNSIEFGELISRNQLIVWGVAKDSEEGKYGTVYKLDQF